SPAIAIRQKNSIRNPRSTVGTTTEIHDYMRLLYARIGRTFCRNCGREVVRETAEVVARALGALPSGTRLLLGFDLPIVAVTEAVGQEVPEVDELAEVTTGPQDPVPGPQEPAHARNGAGAAAIAAAIETLRRKGFGRLLVDGRAVTFDDVDPAALASRPALQVVVDRVQLSGEELRQRLTDSIETAYLEGGGAAWAVESPVDSQQPPVVRQFSELFECRDCGITYEDPK